MSPRVRNFVLAMFTMATLDARITMADNSPDDKPKISDKAYAKMSTNMGDIFIELDAFNAPITTRNFLDYVESGAYDGTIFHRVMSNFMIQGGGFDKDFNEKPTKSPIKNEWKNGLKNEKYSIAMARLGNQPDSATSQFFINVVDNAMLDMPRDGAAYAVFGKVIKGQEVVDAIKMVKTGITLPPGKQPRFNPGEAPVETVLIEKVTRVQPDDAAIKDAVAKARSEEAEAVRRKAGEKQRATDEAMTFVKSKGVDTSKGKTTPSGLWFADIKEGTGATPQLTDKVKVHYTGWLSNGTKFQSSVDQGQPMVHPVNQFTKGWTEALTTMKVGGKRTLIVPPDLAYGARGMPPTIPANATLVFDMELLDIVK